MNVQVNQANLRRVAIHIGLAAAGAAVAAAGLDLSHSNNLEVVSLSALMVTWLGSFIRQEEAVNDSGGQVTIADALAAIKQHLDQRAAMDAEIAAVSAQLGLTIPPQPAPDVPVAPA
jgi:hypothetical protein